MNRDEALTKAIRLAEERQWIMVVFEGNAGEWHCYNYNEYHELGGIGYDAGVRYVLPHHEVTKLS